MMWHKLIHDENGMVLVIVLMILMATVILGMGSMAIVHTDIKIAGNYRDSKAAFFAAEAGVERSVSAMRADLDWTSGYTDASLANGCKYEVAVESPTSYRRTITSTGHFGRSHRRVQIVLDIDSVFRCALNCGGDLILRGKPRISAEGVRANENIILDLDAGTPPLNVFGPAESNITLISDCQDAGGSLTDCGVNYTEAPPMDFKAVKLESSEWLEMAQKAPDSFYYDLDGVFNSKDTDVTLNNFDCNSIEPDENGNRTLFVDGNVNFSGELTGICTVISTGKIIGSGNFFTPSGTTVSMIAMDDVLIDYDTNRQSEMNGLVYTEGSYEMHGKIKFTGVVTALGDVSAQNPSEFTNNNDPNYWYTYSSAYSVIADPIDILSWHEVYDPIS